MAGSEMAAHTLFRYLASTGWEVSVHETRNPSASYSYEGIQLTDEAASPSADVVYTHLWEAWPTAQMAASAADCPIAYWIHANQPKPPPANYLIANTEVLREQWNADIVLHPPVKTGDYLGSGPRDRVTRIGLSEAKGGKVFFELARRMPDHLFLGVVGAWGRQLVELPRPNTQIWGNTRDMAAVYSQTRVLIMPSDGHETYARIGVEAMANGIPVIAHPWDGVAEALGDAAIWAYRWEIGCYQELIECLDDPAEYAHHRAKSLARAEVVDRRTERELVAVERALRRLAS
jgi:glycosyltransferase involved in cell wall biosynthesis